MKKMFYMLSVLTLGLVASCTTDSLDSVVNLETETKIEAISISNKWEKLGIIYGSKGVFDADSVVIGTTYNILYTDNNAIKVYYSEEKKADIMKLSEKSFSLRPHSEVEVLISDFKEDQNKLYFEYTFPIYGNSKVDSKSSIEVVKTREGIWFENESSSLMWASILNEMVRTTNNNGKKSCGQEAIDVCGEGMVKSVISGWLGSCKYECY